MALGCFEDILRQPERAARVPELLAAALQRKAEVLLSQDTYDPVIEECSSLPCATCTKTKKNSPNGSAFGSFWQRRGAESRSVAGRVAGTPPPGRPKLANVSDGGEVARQLVGRSEGTAAAASSKEAGSTGAERGTAHVPSGLRRREKGAVVGTTRRSSLLKRRKRDKSAGRPGAQRTNGARQDRCAALFSTGDDGSSETDTTETRQRSPLLSLLALLGRRRTDLSLRGARANFSRTATPISSSASSAAKISMASVRTTLRI